MTCKIKMNIIPCEWLHSMCNIIYQIGWSTACRSPSPLGWTLGQITNKKALPCYLRVATCPCRMLCGLMHGMHWQIWRCSWVHLMHQALIWWEGEPLQHILLYSTYPSPFLILCWSTSCGITQLSAQVWAPARCLLGHIWWISLPRTSWAICLHWRQHPWAPIFWTNHRHRTRPDFWWSQSIQKPGYKGVKNQYSCTLLAVIIFNLPPTQPTQPASTALSVHSIPVTQ